MKTAIPSWYVPIEMMREVAERVQLRSPPKSIVKLLDHSNPSFPRMWTRGYTNLSTRVNCKLPFELVPVLISTNGASFTNILGVA